MKRARRNTTANLRALDVRHMLAEIERGNAKRLGSGNFGQTYRVAVGRKPYVVKVPVEKNIHGRTWKPNELREAFQAEANAATTLRKLGHTIAPSTLYTEVDGVPVIVREYGEPATLTQEEYDDLSLRLRAVVDAGWAVEDELLVMRRPNRSLFIADVGLWHPYTAKRPRDRQDAQWHAEGLVKTLGAQQPWSNKASVPPKSALESIKRTYEQAREGLDDPEFYAILVGEEAEDRQKAIQMRERAGFTRHNPKTAKRTHPALWERVKAEVTASDKGGLPGQWSARKAQLAVALYQKHGGGYIGPKSPDNALAKWTRERWRTRSGRPSLETGERYLPAKAIAALSPQEYGATTRAKRAGMAAGQQFVPQPERIAMKTAKYRQSKRNPRAARHITDTRAFKRWFGDSKIVDANGKPLVMYHGTSSPNITEFRPDGGREGWQDTLEKFRRAKRTDDDWPIMSFRSGSFFGSFETAAAYARSFDYGDDVRGVVYPVYIKAENPVYRDSRTGKYMGSSTKTSDALIIMDGDEITEIAVMDPLQVKSATGNRGTFDPADPDIRHNPYRKARRNGLLQPPPRMVEAIMAWALDNIQAAQQNRPTRDGEAPLRLDQQRGKDFPFDFRDWKYGDRTLRFAATKQKQTRELLGFLETFPDKESEMYERMKRNLEARLTASLPTLHVRLTYTGQSGGSFGGLGVVRIEFGKFTTKDDVEKIVTHELRHVTQEVLRETADKQPKQQRPFGLPSRKVQTPQWSQQRDKSLQAHVLDDMEFYTDLADAVVEIRRLLSLEKIPERQQALFRDYTDGGRRSHEFFQVLRKHAPAKWRKATSVAYAELFGAPLGAERTKHARRNAGFSMDDFDFFPTETSASPIAPDFRARGRNELEARTGVPAPIFDVGSILKESEPEVEAAGFYTAPYMKGIREVAWAVVAPDAKTAAQATTIGKRLMKKMIPRTKLAYNLPLLVGCPLYVAYPGGVVRVEPAEKR